MKSLLLVVALASACGADPAQSPAPADGNGSRPSSAAGDGIDHADPADETREVVVEYRKDGTTFAITVADTDELPPCTRANSKQLAWVKASQKFFSCEDEVWVEAPIGSVGNPESSQPTPAIAGPAGEKGEKGDTGATGAQGPQGEKGDPGQPVAGNEWFDPITGKPWLIGSVGLTRLLAASACTNGYHLPASGEAITAVAHGLLVASAGIHGPANVWVSDPPEQPSPNDYSFYVNAAGARMPAGFETIGVACVGD